MTPDEQAWMDRVDAALRALETSAPAVQRLRSIPMDMIAVSVMRQLARDGAVMPFTADAIDRAILDIEHRNRGAV
jgi:hypothetical protein